MVSSFLCNRMDCISKFKIGFLIVLGLSMGCKQEAHEPVRSQKKVWFKALHQSGDLVEYRHELTLYTDSTFVYDSKEKDHGHSKYEKFEGIAFIQNDTLHFSRNDMNGAGNKAVLKNGMLEFANGTNSFRLEVVENHTPLKSVINLRNYPDFALFTYYPSKKRDRNTPYDLSPAEFEKVRELIHCVFEEQKANLKSDQDYIKQLIPYRNKKGELEVRVNMFCKDKLDPNGFKYRTILMNDGGKCNVTFVVIFKSNYYVDFSIAGEA